LAEGREFAMSGVDEIIRQWVQKVEATGELRKIPGFGEPFQFDDGFLETPTELRMAYKILKNAGYVPAEIELLQKLAAMREELNATQDVSRRRELELGISETQQKVTMMLDAMRRRR
jgi:DnaJ homologue, subfamily C, member 28, conserved domain